MKLIDFLNTKYYRQLERLSSSFDTYNTSSSLSKTLDLLSKLFYRDFLLIGGLSRSLHASPRMTYDVDLLFRREADLKAIRIELGDLAKTIPGRNHAVKINGVEVEILTPEFLGIPEEIASYVFGSKEQIGNGLYTASPTGLILLKLCRASNQDIEDILAVMKAKPQEINTSVLKLLAPDVKLVDKLIAQNKIFFNDIERV